MPRYFARIYAALLLTALAALPVWSQTRSEIRYVSPKGNDAWSGKLAAPNAAKTDGPFATLERARDALRPLPNGLPTAPEPHKYIEIRGGTYFRDRTLTLTSADSGLGIRSRPGETVRLIGGRTVSGWKPVTDAAVLARLDPAARGNVLQCDLPSQGVHDFGKMTAIGFGRPDAPAPLELFWNDRPMTIARWPNVGSVPNADQGQDSWAKIAATPAGQNGGAFTYDGDRPTRWKDDDDVWLHGYWTWDWADSYEKVVAIDPATKTITTAPPHGVYGYTPGKRWYALNVLEELDTPGEYYVDRKTGTLYFWPPSPVSAGQAVVSVLETPLIRIEGAAHVSLERLTLEAARGNGIEVENGSGDSVGGCTIRNMGEAGVIVRGGQDVEIGGDRIYGVGSQGVLVSGGDRKTLVGCHNQVSSCDIHDYSRWVRTYRAGVGVSGVGISVKGCHIHDAPHNAILLSGNDNSIVGNQIDHVCTETGDAGAFYIGRDWTMRGNIVRGNWFHDMNGVQGQKGFTEVMAVYLDDCASGTTVERNIFQRIHGRAIMIGGGRDNHVLNNLFVACRIAIHVDARAQGWARAAAAQDGDWKMYEKLQAIHYDQPPYSTRYPELARMLSEDPSFPKGTQIERNVVAETPADGQWIELQNGLTDKTIDISNNLTEGDAGLIDGGPPHLSKDSPAYKLGFQTLLWPPLDPVKIP